MRFNLLLFSFIIFCGYSCVEPIVGCLNPEATNYQIDGDEACEDQCCTFPVMSISIFHQFQDTTFFLEDTLVNSFDQEYSIIDFVYFLSDWQFKTSEGVWHSISDSISLDQATETVLEKDDVIRVNRNTFTYELGTSIFDGFIDEIQFQFGISENFNTLEFTNPVDNHPLTTDPDSLMTDDGYVMMRILIAQGIELQDTVIYEINDNSQVLPSQFTIESESLRGSNKNIRIQALYNKWFENVDFEMMNKEEIESRLSISMEQLFDSI